MQKPKQKIPLKNYIQTNFQLYPSNFTNPNTKIYFIKNNSNFPTYLSKPNNQKFSKNLLNILKISLTRHTCNMDKLKSKCKTKRHISIQVILLTCKKGLTAIEIHHWAYKIDSEHKSSQWCYSHSHSIRKLIILKSAWEFWRTKNFQLVNVL